MSKKYKNVCRVLNYIDLFLFVISTITRCVSISAFASLVGISIGILSSTMGLKICAITAGNKMSINKKNKNMKQKHGKIISLENSN